jgi:hypothetical protein
MIGMEGETEGRVVICYVNRTVIKGGKETETHLHGSRGDVEDKVSKSSCNEKGRAIY